MRIIQILNRQWFRIIVNLIIFAGSVSHSFSQVNSLYRVDFKYAPIWWQSVISLPDDRDKVVIGKEGQLLFEISGRHAMLRMGRLPSK